MKAVQQLSKTQQAFVSTVFFAGKPTRVAARQSTCIALAKLGYVTVASDYLGYDLTEDGLRECEKFFGQPRPVSQKPASVQPYDQCNFWCDVCGAVVYGLPSDHEHPLRTAFAQLTAARQDFCRRLYVMGNLPQEGLFVTGASKDAMVTGGWIQQLPSGKYTLTPAASAYFEQEQSEPAVLINQPGEHAIEGTDLYLMLREGGNVSIYRKQGNAHMVLTDSLDANALAILAERDKNAAARREIEALRQENSMLLRKLALAEQGLKCIQQ